MAQVIKNKEEYFEIRNSAENINNFENARKGDKDAKKKLAQFNYNAQMPDGVLKGCRHIASTFAHDIDCNSPEKQKEIIGEMLEMKEQIGLLELSGSANHGLHAVCRREKGKTIFENQIRLSTLTQTEMDTSAHDLGRVMFTGPASDDVLFYLDDALFDEQLDLEEAKREYKLLKEREKRGEEEIPQGARHGGKHYCPWKNQETTPQPVEAEAKPELPDKLTYDGISYDDIIKEWWVQDEGEPEVGSRNSKLFKLAVNLRAICDYDQELLMKIMPRYGLDEQEMKSIIDSACKEPIKGISSKLSKVLKKLTNGHNPSTIRGRGDIPYEMFSDRLEPLLTSPYKEACHGLSRNNWMGAVYASGTMYGTLLTRCWYLHHKGNKQRINPNAMIIGHPASGKSFARDLDDNIMFAMREQDEVIREQENRYKKEQKKRNTSAKEQQQDGLVEPDGMIRYLPSNTSNNIFYRRQLRAKEMVDGELTNLHLYTFDSELDSSITAQSGGSWITKHPLELKAFHNENAGVDYANNDSMNAVIPIYWNQVITGTMVSLKKKFTLRNINDGFCSRVAIFPMESNFFVMEEKNTVNTKMNEALKQWGYKFDKLHGELPLKPLTDYVYKLCEQSADEAKANNDLVLDYLRRRGVFFATWFTIPRIIARQYDEFVKTGKLEINDDDLKFASLIFDSTIYFQDYFFGQMLQDSWDNLNQDFTPRRKNSRNTDAYQRLSDEFTSGDVMRELGIERDAAYQQCQRWEKHGFIEKVKKGRFRKIVQDIIF